MATTSNENSNTSPASSRTTSRPSSGRGWRRSRSGASNPSRVSSGSTAEASPGAPLRSGSNVSIDENGVQRRASKPKAAMRWTKDVLKNSFDSLFSRESRDEQAPMMIFYKATARLKKCVRLLESATLELEQILGIEELHRCQTEVLNALEMVFSISNDPRESRDYRLKFSADVQEELQHTLLWETLLFAAELITDGRVLEGRERVTDRLRPTAIYLCDSFESVNRVLRAQAKKNPTVYTPAVLAALRQFDIAWTAFENLYVQAVVPCRGNEDFETRQEITILFSEGVLLGLRKKYITQTDIDDYEPMVMQAIPRLGVLTGILQNPEELVNYKWMADSATLLKSISERMVGLAPGDIQKLEIYLVEGVDDAPKGDMSAERADVGPVTAKPEVLHKLFVDISQVADDMCRGPKNKGHRQILSTLFKMYQNQPIDITSDEPVTRISNIDDVEITNDDDTDPLNDGMCVCNHLSILLLRLFSVYFSVYY
ncbi:hypothetical protein SARC_04340 [Sphaeroforma arctica JP610]|uniref:Uncharacterized protein n=1 Tax=Sphaeroforma arctica JP610 TaxID=667725 RepID=A0A0L0G3F0_9EUKA|nr:hypothetical protein SARC_04340 [Sphaeroforma arctica JP610]KNC83399.1 hypothetical protein SARC_04340 [Sphaeroforma arctica JP610]|eukprot:XP_014157301.1 hypothetical protein SARC_04340 [Sphaeroforma arctica JP610]